MRTDDLTELFRKLGAPNPAEWARSQRDENLPQLARFLFLREAWKLVVADDDPSWIRDRIADDPSGPGGEIVPALKRLLVAGVTGADLTTVVRIMQWRVLFGLCLLLDAPPSLEEEVKDIAWRLFQVDEDERPTIAITGVHESVLETDPTGREMGPRN